MTAVVCLGRGSQLLLIYFRPELKKWFFLQLLARWMKDGPLSRLAEGQGMEATPPLACEPYAVRALARPMESQGWALRGRFPVRGAGSILFHCPARGRPPSPGAQES